MDEKAGWWLVIGGALISVGSFMPWITASTGFGTLSRSGLDDGGFEHLDGDGDHPGKEVAPSQGRCEDATGDLDPADAILQDHYLRAAAHEWMGLYGGDGGVKGLGGDQDQVKAGIAERVRVLYGPNARGQSGVPVLCDQQPTLAQRADIGRAGDRRHAVARLAQPVGDQGADRARAND